MSFCFVTVSLRVVVGLKLEDVPEGAVAMTISQVLACQRAAVRMERNLDSSKDRKLSKSELIFWFVLSISLIFQCRGAFILKLIPQFLSGKVGRGICEGYIP